MGILTRYIHGNMMGYKRLWCHQGSWDVSCSSCLFTAMQLRQECSELDGGDHDHVLTENIYPLVMTNKKLLKMAHL